MGKIALLVVAILALALLFGIGGLALPAAGLLGALLLNSLIGLLILYVLNAVGVHIPINIVTLLVVLIFGLGGIVLLCLLAFFRVYGAVD